MDFQHPTVAYEAATNLEAHVIVEMLLANGIEALAVEDQSGVSLWSFGTISQFHKPKIWIEKENLTAVAQLIQEFEESKRQRNQPIEEPGDLEVVCEECGKATLFPAKLEGTLQECTHCDAYVDVGDLPWEDDFGEPEA